MSETLGQTAWYIWQKAPLLLLFANGYLVYRLLAVNRLTDLFLVLAVDRAGGRPGRLTLYIVLSTALLSAFIPNTISVLAILPVLKAMVENVPAGRDRNRLVTALTLSAIYGANIGGMGSLIGSPANLLLIGALDFFKVTGREEITFFSWFVWSVPLTAMFLALAWGLIRLLPLPDRIIWTAQPPPSQAGLARLAPDQRAGVKLFFLFLGFWIAESGLRLYPAYVGHEGLICLAFFSLFAYLVFVRAWPGMDGRRLLRLPDLASGLPKRGIYFLLVIAGIMVIIQVSHLDKLAAGAFSGLFGSGPPKLVFILALTLAVIFLTEVMSNTVVAAAFFPIAFRLSTAQDLNPLILMLCVSLASTCAFMTPIATPCNALAFGEMKGVSVRSMLGLGFVLNLIGAGLMSLWLAFIIPIVYR